MVQFIWICLLQKVTGDESSIIPTVNQRSFVLIFLPKSTSYHAPFCKLCFQHPFLMWSLSNAYCWQQQSPDSSHNDVMPTAEMQFQRVKHCVRQLDASADDDDDARIDCVGTLHHLADKKINGLQHLSSNFTSFFYLIRIM